MEKEKGMSRLCRFDESDVYDGRVAGLYRPLSVKEEADAFAVEG